MIGKRAPGPHRQTQETISARGTGNSWGAERHPLPGQPVSHGWGTSCPPWGRGLAKVSALFQGSGERNKGLTTVRALTPLTASSLSRLRSCTSQSGSRSRSLRLSTTKGSDSFSFSASCARFPAGSGAKVREGKADIDDGERGNRGIGERQS